jgi:uncharacterized RDD family membrane protein YckC
LTDDSRENEAEPTADPMAPESSFFLDGLSFGPEVAGRVAIPLPEDTENFHFLREIGRGGMGVVYAAEDRIAGREVAVKLVHPGLALSAEAKARFGREARAAAAIHHERCVFVYGAHEVHGIPAIAMELMSGETLEDRIKSGGPVEPLTALGWIEDLLDGLETAHERGLLHRDIKPSNLFLDDAGGVKIGDFGLSRPENMDLSLTRTGMFLGSPLYCSPEQARGREVDVRSDIYSVGATLYALLTGQAPFDSTNIGDLFARIAAEDPKPPRDIVPSIPIGLDQVVMRAMAKDPKDRFRNAREMRIALAAYQPGSHSNAALGLRIAAFLVDVVGVGVVASIVQALTQLALLSDFAPAALREMNGLTMVFREASSALIFMLYFALFEKKYGATPGKYLFGLRVIGAGGGKPSLRMSLLRSGFFVLEEIIGLALARSMRSFASLVNLLPLVTMRRRNGFRGLHEFVSKTRTVAIRSRVRRLIERRGAFDPRRAEEPKQDLVEPAGYEIIARVARVGAHELVLAHEPRLARNVWMIPSAAVQETGNRRERNTLRWLDGPEGWAIFEDPGGASLFGYARNRPELDWLNLREHLLEIAELFEEEDEAEFDRIWIDRRGRTRLLPFAIEPDGDAPTARTRGLEAACRALTGGDRRLWIDDLPEGGSNFLKRARGDRTPFASAAEIREALLALGEPGERPTRGHRIAHFMINAFGISLGIGLFFLVGVLVFDLDDRSPEEVLRPLPVTLIYLLSFGLPSAFLAWLFRGGPVLRMLNLRLYDRAGERASSMRAGVRGFVTHLPLAFLGICLALAEKVLPEDGAIPAFISLAAIVAGCQLIYAMVRPSHSLADLVTRTHLTHLNDH